MAKVLVIPKSIDKAQETALREIYWCASMLVSKEEVTVHNLRTAIEEKWGDRPHWKGAIRVLKEIEIAELSSV